MKKTLFSGLFFIMMMQCGYSEGPDPVDRFVAQKAREMQQKYPITFFGLGGGATAKGIHLVSVDFNFKGEPLDIPKSRRLVIQLTEELLEAINSNLSLQSLLSVHPFTSKNISVGIFCYDKNNQSVFDPAIDTISMGCKQVGYFTREKGEKYKFKSEIYETYAEALTIVNAEE